ncbi:MAG: ABC transporter ATP-binding protein [Phyllobacteriaceae bacterium]|jgi:lipopolysaccharide transport system ATP-binding protein|nr:ABC transporter ATP-binding protein [Phyllobacteriaceae bacterium]
MAHLSLQNLTVDFPIYGANSRSLKRRLVSHATGGRIAEGTDDAVVVRALDDVSIEIKDGDRIGLVGHNGAGKSTFLRTVAGIYKPTAGSITITGEVGTLIDPAAGMDPEATGIENIYLRGYVLGMDKGQIADLIDEIADFTELGDFLDLPVKTYSAGMFSRLGFAVSTAIKPDILLIDEGIGAGDAAFQERAAERIEELKRNVRILVVASHDNSLLESLGCRPILFSAGKIVDDGRGGVG